MPAEETDGLFKKPSSEREGMNDLTLQGGFFYLGGGWWGVGCGVMFDAISDNRHPTPNTQYPTPNIQTPKRRFI
jgi:hypothetical protein